MDRNIDRFSYTNASQTIKPKDNIVCRQCIYRRKDTLDGYKRAICAKYSGKNGNSFKPKSILFGNDGCIHFKEE